LDDNGLIDLFLDDDDDGIPNLADISSTGGNDVDDDGIDDIADINQTGGADINNNGIDDAFEADPDADGRAVVVASNVSLPDADGDGVPDVLDTADAKLITGVGCSIGGDSQRLDPLFPGLVLLTGLVLFRRKPTKR